MRADRLISMVLALQSRGKTTTQTLAAELGVSRRTILRDLEALSLAGIPVFAEGGHRGGVSLDAAYRTSLTGMKEPEVRALLASVDGRLLSDLGWGEAYRLGRDKLQASIPRRYEASMAYVRQRLLIDSRWWWHEDRPDQALETLQQAVFADRVVEGTYETYDGRVAPWMVEAYGLVAKAGLWYFVGRRTGEFRTYRVSRVIEARLGTEAFLRDPAFDLSRWWPQHQQQFAQEFSAYRFVVAIPEDQLRYLRSIAPGRVTVLGPDSERQGWIEVEGRLDSALYAELVVLGLGSACRILDPPDLKLQVVARAKEAWTAHS